MDEFAQRFSKHKRVSQHFSASAEQLTLCACSGLAVAHGGLASCPPLPPTPLSTSSTQSCCGCAVQPPVDGHYRISRTSHSVTMSMTTRGFNSRSVSLCGLLCSCTYTQQIHTHAHTHAHAHPDQYGLVSWGVGAVATARRRGLQVRCLCYFGSSSRTHTYTHTHTHTHTRTHARAHTYLHHPLRISSFQHKSFTLLLSFIAPIFSVPVMLFEAVNDPSCLLAADGPAFEIHPLTLYALVSSNILGRGGGACPPLRGLFLRRYIQINIHYIYRYKNI
jgi:hypothetical protein